MSERFDGSSSLRVSLLHPPNSLFRPCRYPPKGKVGRVAVHKQFRGTGAGSTLCLALEEHVRERRGKAADVMRGKTSFDLVAHSQKIAEVFYHRLGWETVGEDFLEVRSPLLSSFVRPTDEIMRSQEGQPHCKVVKTIQLKPECVRTGNMRSDVCLLCRPCP